MQSPSAAPAPMMEPEARQRFGETMFMASISPALFGFALFLSDQPAPFWSVQIAFGVLMFAVRFWVLRSRDPRLALLAIHLLAGGGLFLIGWHAMYTGQSKSFALWFLPLIPLMSALLGSVRAAIA